MSAESKNAVFDYDTIIINLKTLSKIHNNQKLYLAQPDLLEIDNYYLLPLRRTIYNLFWDGYNRDAITTFIDTLIHSIILTSENLCREYRRGRKAQRQRQVQPSGQAGSLPGSPSSINFSDTIEEKIKNLNLHIHNSIEGLRNLSITYEQDTKIKAHIDNLINKLRNLITKLDNLFMLKH